MQDIINLKENVGATHSQAAALIDQIASRGQLSAKCYRPKPERLGTFLKAKAFAGFLFNLGLDKLAHKAEALMLSMCDVVWTECNANTVMDEGKTAMLQNFINGSAYTATKYFGLISSVSYTAIAVGDTMAQIAGTNGWREAGAANAPTFSARVAATFSAAAAKSITTSATSNFTMTGAGTVKGAFLVMNGTSAIVNTTGSLYMGGLFSGDKVVVTNDVIQVSYTTSIS